MNLPRAAHLTLVTLVLATACGSDEIVELHRSLPPIVSPQTIILGVGGTQQITASLGGTNLPFVKTATGDSCKARVTTGGLVKAIGPGVTQVSLEFTSGPQSWTTAVPVTVTESAALRLTIQSITSGAAPADLSAVRDTIVVTANVDAGEFAGVELRLAGRYVESQPLLELDPATAGVLPASFVVNTAARDAAGQPMFPNGAQVLEVVGTRRPYAPGCPTGTETVWQSLALANP